MGAAPDRDIIGRLEQVGRDVRTVGTMLAVQSSARQTAHQNAESRVSEQAEDQQEAEPSASEIDGGILSRFTTHQAGLIQHIEGIPRSIDRRGTIVTSPLLSWVTYSLDDCLTILLVHENRHLQQAKRVPESEGFPGEV